jgi:small-conductance mechanosensitive channel/CRP-like cAMP-binding protein
MKSAGRILVSRMLFPATGVLILLVLRSDLIRENLVTKPRIHRWLDALFIFFIVFFMLRLLDALARSWFNRRGRCFPLPRLLHSVILGILYLAAFFIILRIVLDVNITPFLATSALLTMILGLAFQDLLQNIISGLSLHFIKSFNKGDWIQVGEREGVVVEVNWRETRVFDRYSNVVVIPNKAIAIEKLTNFSYPTRTTALTIPVRISYTASPSDVFEAMTLAARDCPEVLERPQPEALLLAYEDFGIKYAAKFWISDFSKKYTIMAEVGRNIWYRFQRSGIEIPLPLNDKLQEVLHMSIPQQAKPGERETERIFSVLQRSNFLRQSEERELLVSKETLRDFSRELRWLRFAPNEMIFRQGDRGETCYVVASGRIKGSIRTVENGKELTTEFTVEPYRLFGEMSLFTGMPRTAAGRAEEETRLIEISKDAFAGLLQKQPSLAESIAEIISRRNQENRENLEKIRELSDAEIKKSTDKKSILARLKSFFS